MLVVGARTSSADATINNNYTELFKSRLVLDGTIKQQGYSGDYEQLLTRTTATNDKNTDVIKVSIADTNPGKSQKLLAASVESFKKEAGKIYGSNNIKTVDSATLPVAPYNVHAITQIGLAMAATFFLAVIVLFFIYDYATSYKNTGGAATSNPAKKKPASKKASTKKVVKKGNSYVAALLSRLSVLLTGEPKKPVAKKN